MANPIERTSSIRGILAYTWFDPDRDFVKFFKNNEKRVYAFARDTMRVPSAEIDDFVMTYFESAYKHVWLCKPMYPNKDDDDSEFIRRVKNRLWSYSSGWKTKASLQKDRLVHIDQMVYDDGEGGESNIFDIPSNFTLEREIEGQQNVKKFLNELETQLKEAVPGEDGENLFKAYSYMFHNESTCTEAIRESGIKARIFHMHRSTYKNILENIKNSYDYLEVKE